MEVWILICLIGALALFGFLMNPERIRRQEQQKLIRARAPVSDRELLETYFSQSDLEPGVITGVRKLVGRAKGVHPEKLVPSDRLYLGGLLPPPVDLKRELEFAFQIRIPGSPFPSPKATLREVMVEVDRLVRKKREEQIADPRK